MQIDKSQVLELLRSQGDQDKASQADQQLPDQVDTDQHAGLLQQLGINPMDLVKALAGGGAGGGLGGLLGGGGQGGGEGGGGGLGGLLGGR